MKYQVNGKLVESLEDQITLTEAITHFGYPPEQVLASVNDQVIAQNEYGKIIIVENDKIELFCFVNGG